MNWVHRCPRKMVSYYFTIRLWNWHLRRHIVQVTILFK